MGRASLDRLRRGSSTGAGQAAARPRERHGRLGSGLRGPAGPGPPSSSSPTATGSRLPRLARASALAAVCLLLAAVCLLLAAGMAEAQQACSQGRGGQVDFESGGVQHADGPNRPTGCAVPTGNGQITIWWQTASTGPSTRAISTAYRLSGSSAWGHWNAYYPGSSRVISGLDPTKRYDVLLNPRSEAAKPGERAIARGVRPAEVWGDAGSDVTVRAGARVALGGTGSYTARRGATLTHAWTQTAGPKVALDDATSATPAFTAPSVSSQTTLTFSLTVSDGTTSETDTVTVTVLPSRIASARVDGSTLTVTFDTALNTASRPQSSAFTVHARKTGSSREIAGTNALVSISGKTVTATLSEAVAADERLTVRYDKPASGAVLKDSASGIAVESMPAQHAANAGDTTAPTLQSATIDDGLTLTLTYDELLKSGAVPVRGRYQIRFGQAPLSTPVSDPVVSGKTVSMRVRDATDPVRHDEAVRFLYNRPTGAPEQIQDLSGNPAEGITSWRAVTNNTPPAFKSASVNGAVLTVTFDGGLDTTSEPAGSAFTVKHTRSGTETTLGLASSNPVVVSSATVTLNLALSEPMLSSDAVTVAYAAPATGAKLQDADKEGFAVPDFAAQTATNATPADATGPTLQSATIDDGLTLTLTYDELLKSGAVPVKGRYLIRFGQSSPSSAVSDPVVSGKTVSMRVRDATDPVRHDEAVRFLYNRPTGAPEQIQDLSGNPADGITSWRAVTNNTPPAFKSASVNGAVLTLTFDAGLDTGSVPAGSAFTVKHTRSGTETTLGLASSNPVVVSSATVTLNLALSEPMLSSDAVTVAYAAPATGAKLQDADKEGFAVPDFAAQTATNATPADATGPTLQSATIDDGLTLTLTYDELLKSGAVPVKGRYLIRFGQSSPSSAVSDPVVSGKTVSMRVRDATDPVRHDEAVRFLYNRPTGAPEQIQDLSGNPADGITSWRAVTNNTPPAFKSASVNGAVLTVTFDEGLDTTSVPAGSAFTVKHTRSGTETTLSLASSNPVAVSGATVTLNLALSEPMLSSDAVTVAYEAPATGKLRDADNAKLPVLDFDDVKTAMNATPADATGPAFVSAEANGKTVTVTFDELLDESVTAASSIFQRTIVQTGGELDAAISTGVSISGRTATVTFATAVTHDQAGVTILHTMAGNAAKRIKDLSDNDAPSFSAKPVTNNTPPGYKSASVNGAVLTMTFDAGLDTGSVPAGSAFTVKRTRSGTETTLSLAASNPVAVSSSTVTLNLAEAVLRVDKVTVAYAAPASGDKLQDADKAMLPVPDFPAQTATNATPADTTGPAFVSATMSGNTATITFDELLDESVSLHQTRFQRTVDGIHSVSIGARALGRTVIVTFLHGAALRHGDVVTLSYGPATNPSERVKDLSGNDAPAFTSKTGTNNTPPTYKSASVDRAVLTVTFDGALDEDAVPAGSAFTVTLSRVGEQDRTLSLLASDPVAVSGAKVTLALAEAVRHRDTVTVAYAAPATGAKLRDADNAMLAVTNFADVKLVDNETPADTTAPALVRAEANGATVVFTYDEALDDDVTPLANAYQRTVDGAAAEESTAASISGRTVTATFATAVAHGQAVRVWYIRATNAADRIKDVAGNEAPVFSNVAADNVTPVPEVRIASLTITSAPTVDADGDGTPETYGAGERIGVRVTWSADVLWDASAAGAELAVGLDVGGTARKALLVTGGASEGRTRTFTFQYTVVRADRDADGIVLKPTAANDLVVLSGGATLKDAQGRNVSRTHAALSGGAGHKVDGARSAGTDTKAPELAAGAVGAEDGRRMTLTFDEALATPSAETLRNLVLAFSVRGGYHFGAPVGTPRDTGRMYPNEVAVSGATVTLTFRTKFDEQELLLPGHTFKVSYSGPSTDRDLNPQFLADASGNKVAAFDVEVTRPGGSQAVAPALTLPQVAGNKLTLTFDRALDAASAPAGRRFAVQWRKGYHAPEQVSRGTGTVVIEGRTVSVTLDAAVPQGASAKVTYRKGDDAKPLRGASGGAAAVDVLSFFGVEVADRTPPALAQAVLSGTSLTLYYDEALDSGSVPAGGDFTVVEEAGGTTTTLTVSSVALRGNNALTLTLSASAGSTSTVKVSYDVPGTNPVQDALGNRAVNFSGRDVDINLPSIQGAPVLQTTHPPVVASSTLTLTFTLPLDPASVPAADAFSLSGQSVNRTVTSVAVRGVSVELGLSWPVDPCGAAPAVSYAVPATNPLRSLSGTNVAAFGGQAVTNEYECTSSYASSSLSGRQLRAEFSRALNPETPPRAAHFRVSAEDSGAGGAGARSRRSVAPAAAPVTVEAARLSADARAVELTLSRAAARGERLTVRYALPPPGTGLWDADGNQVAPFTGQAVAPGPPAVSAVAVTSDAGSDDTYALGERVRVALTFDRAVEVDTSGGTPALSVDMDPAEWGEKRAAYESGSGTATLTFVHEVVEPNVSTQGIAVLADTLALNGGTIREAATQVDAALGHAGLDHDAAHKVDWRLAPERPAVTTVALASDPGADATYAAGDAVRVAVTFDAAVEVDTDGGTPRLKLDLGGDDGAGERRAGYEEGSGTATLTFAWTAAAPDEASAGVAVLADTLELDGGAIKSAATQEDAALGHAGLDRDAGHKVDAVAPSVASASVSGTALTVTFDEDLAAAGSLANGAFAVKKTPPGGTATAVALSATTGPAIGGRTVTLTLAGAVVSGDTAIEVSYAKPTAGSANALVDAAGNAVADFTGRAVANATAPAATGVALVSDPGADATYAAGDTVRVAVTFGEAVAVDTTNGTPRLKLDLDDDEDTGERQAAYESGSGTDTLTFAWTAAAPDEAPAGVAVLADTLELDGGAIKSAATQEDAALGHAGLDRDAGHKVDAVAPRLLRGEIDGATMTLTFSEALDAEATGGRFQMNIQTSETEAIGCYATGEVAVEGATVTVGLGEGGCPTARAGLTEDNYLRYFRRADGADGSFRDLAGNLLAPDGDSGVGLYVYIDLANVTGGAPRVTGVAVVSDAGDDATYAEGETVEAAVTFDAPVRVETEGGAPTLALIANGGIRRAAYVSGTGTARLAFAYRVTEADGRVQAPVRVAASGLKRNGGAIVAAAGGAPASLGFGAAPGVTAVSVGTQTDGRWEAGDTVEAVLTFAEPVAVEGAPTVAVTFGDVERRAAYARGSGGERLTFAYTLAEGEVWQGAPGLAGDSLRLDGGSIASAGGGLAAALAHPEVEGAAETPPPSVAAVAVISDAGSDATYGLGERIRLRVSFTGAVTVTGTPEIAIDMDPAAWGTKRAVYERGTGSPTLTFVHEVVEPNISTQGIAVLANTLDANGGAIVSTATGADALLGHAGLAHDAGHKVDWRLAPAVSSSGSPAVTAVAVVSDAGSDNTYLLGDVIRVRLTFGEAVKVTGTPTLAIDMDPAEWGTKSAAYEGATGTAVLSLTFAHEVVEPNLSRPGIAVLANTLTLNGGTIRSAASGAAAALGHAGLGHDVAHKVDWRPALSVADARAREGVDEAVAFEVSLDRAFTSAEHRVTVDYATADGTAVAGEDYTATSGSLTFAAGERVKTVSVPILDDGHDEGHETFSLRLSNLAGARASDLEATGTIENTDKMPKAWLARFGRTVAEQVVGSVQARLEAPRAAGAQATLGGQALPSWAPGAGPDGRAANDNAIAAAGFGGDAAARRGAERLAQWLAGTEGRDDEARPEDRSMTGREVLVSTTFSLTAAPEDGGASVALWGRGATSSFSGRDGPLSVDGEVTSAALGADWRSGRWLGGLMVKHSIGEGSYSGDDGAGEVESQLTGLYPYAAVDLGARLRAWAAAGLGEGTLTLTPKNPETGEADPAMETDMSLGMAALGAEGNLVEPAGGSGFRLDVEADAFWVRTSSDAVRSAAGNLAGAQADVTRLRLGLDGGYAFALPGSESGTGDGGGTLEPTFELGLRHDGGDAETGWGVDIGGGLRWADPARGLSAEVSGRGLIAHEAAGLKDRGISGSLAWDPDPASDRGPSLSLTQTLGAQAAGGADALLGRQTLDGLAANDNGMNSRRLEMKLGYGLPASGDRFTSTPELGFALSDAAREYRLGWRLTSAMPGDSGFEVNLDATRKEPVGGDAPVEHGAMLRAAVRW